jgi:hypothetical protein
VFFSLFATFLFTDNPVGIVPVFTQCAFLSVLKIGFVFTAALFFSGSAEVCRRARRTAVAVKGMMTAVVAAGKEDGMRDMKG